MKYSMLYGFTMNVPMYDPSIELNSSSLLNPTREIPSLCGLDLLLSILDTQLVKSSALSYRGMTRCYRGLTYTFTCNQKH